MDYYKLRKEKKLSQTEVALLCGVSLVTYQLWERGVTTPTDENQVKLNQALGIKFK